MTVNVHPPATIDSLGTNPQQPEATVPFDLEWTVSNGTQVVVTDASNNVLCTVTDPALVATGSCQITEAMAGTYDYTVTVTGLLPSDVTSQTLTVTVYPLLAINSFTVNGQTSDVFISTGTPVDVAWDVTGAQAISLLEGNTDITPPMPGPTGSVTRSPTATVTYVLQISDTADFSGRVKAAQVTVYVDAAQVTLLEASATTIVAGQSTDITWDTTNADTVSFSPPVSSSTGNTFTSIAGQPGAVDITGDFTGFSPLDTGVADIDLSTLVPAFDFPFDGQTFNTFQVAADGYLAFGTSLTSSSTLNDPIPDSGTPNGFIAAFWDDLDGSAAGSVHYQVSGIAPNRTLTVEWNSFEVFSFSGMPGDLTFQIVLHESGDMEIRYLTMQAMNPSDDARYHGSSATVGYENLDGTDGYELLHNTADSTIVGDGIGHYFGLASAPASGSRTVSPTETTTYEVCATGGGYTDCKQVTVVVVQPGDILVSEFLANPAAVPDSDGEWFEVTNVAGYDIDLTGFVISDNGTDTYTVQGPLVVPAGGTAVLGRNADPQVNGGVSVDEAYGPAFSLANSSDEIIITFNGVEIDRVEYDTSAGWTIDAGIANSVDPNLLMPGDPTVNDSGWCQSNTPYGQGDLGTPNAPNDVSCRVLANTITPALAIPDGSGNATSCGAAGAVSVQLTLPNVPPGATIADVDVGVTISHTYNSDLDIFLEYDDGAGNVVCVELSTDNGGSGDGYLGVVFDDEALDSIVNAPTGVLSGPYQSEGLLSDLDGLDPSGIWTLWVSDDVSGDTGTLEEFTVRVTLP